MTGSRVPNVRVVLLDIEGTTTPIAFVYGVLMPFAAERLSDWCRRHAASRAYRDVSDRLAAEHALERARGDTVPSWSDDSPDAVDRSLQAFARWLMERDRKSPALKLLQGLIWEEGYQSGLLRGDVFADVAPAMRRWHDAGIRIAIYSSGSELAQRRLFESTPAGDLTRLIERFFDTGVGAKTSAASYTAIAAELRTTTGKMMFVSDVTAELAAAKAAGCHTILCVRPGNYPQDDAGGFPRISTFDDLDIQDR